MGLIYEQWFLGNFQYGCVHKVQFFMIANAPTSTLQEYEKKYVDIQQKSMQVRITTI